MKLNINFSSFKKNHKSKKDQLFYAVKNVTTTKKLKIYLIFY